MITSFSRHSASQEFPELDQGGWARLDVSDLVLTSEDNNDNLSTQSCGWCEEETANGEYVVVADNRHYHVCPTCWGRSAGYLELRRAGLAHETALGRLSGTSAQYLEGD